MANSGLRLGVNIDHVATIRNARGGLHPDPLRAAQIAAEAGADGITAHLREDRRHISDTDISRLVREVPLPLNLEMAATDEMLDIALRHRPHAACIVPEKRNEVTTEGGLDVASGAPTLRRYVEALNSAGIRTALFIDPDLRQVTASKDVGAACIELHTGTYCNVIGPARRAALEAIVLAARHAAAVGLEVHAGHGLSYETAGPVASVPEIVELNIGHFLVGEGVFVGLGPAIRRMRRLMDGARAPAGSQTANGRP